MNGPLIITKQPEHFPKISQTSNLTKTQGTTILFSNVIPTVTVALIQRNDFLPIQTVPIQITEAWCWDTITDVHLQGSTAVMYIPQISAE